MLREEISRNCLQIVQTSVEKEKKRGEKRRERIRNIARLQSEIFVYASRGKMKESFRKEERRGKRELENDAFFVES